MTSTEVSRRFMRVIFVDPVRAHASYFLPTYDESAWVADLSRFLLHAAERRPRTLTSAVAIGTAYANESGALFHHVVPRNSIYWGFVINLIPPPPFRSSTRHLLRVSESGR